MERLGRQDLTVIEPIRRSRLYQGIVEQIEGLLEKGDLRPGDPLPPERQLAEQFQVSRATVREALRLMEHQSLIVSHHGSGNFIAQGSAGNLAKAMTQFALRDIFEARLIFDPSLAALAARRAT